jgi:predicted RecB family nuclease
MREGPSGIYQPVLQRGRYLAIPDFIERVEDGDGFHYAPGDVKTGLSPRADQVLQVAFAGWLLRDVQGIAPARGFLVLGDGRREDFPLDDLAHVLQAARERVEEILAGRETTAPFYGPACGPCRWSGTCLPGLLGTHDLSLVDGMTPTRRRVLRSAGVDTLEALAGVDPAEWRATGRPALDIDTLARQAQALAAGRTTVRRPMELPERGGAEAFVHVERDPLDGGSVIALAWSIRAAGGSSGEVRTLLSAAERVAAFDACVAALPRGAPLYHFGTAVPRGLALLCALAGARPELQIELEERSWDLALSLRRGTAFLPVRRYVLDEIAAVLEGRPLPSPAGRGTPPYVLTEHLRRGSPGPWRERLDESGRAQLMRLERLHEWMRAQPTRPPRPRPR